MVSAENIGLVLKVIQEAIKEFEVPAVSHFNRSPFHVLFSCILSLRTKDKVTIEASRRLFGAADSCSKLIELNEKEIERLIFPVGFYKTKAKRIKEIAKILYGKGCKVPETMDELLKLPGVGRKTANLVIAEGFGRPAICVDTHVHRISNRIGLIKSITPFESEMELRKALPRKYWIEYNKLLVAFGQNICVPVSPFCSKCPIESLCPKTNVKKSR
ncbi:MAG TPA: endonuclease III [Candidatus Woesearchaeota archaeon]|nr:endonuclease III [Candidatus Woesearchaeota archaeon]